MIDYYATQRREGEAFERYLAVRLRAAGRHVARHADQASQYAHGDLRVDGIDLEIKFDTLAATTGNLYLEVAEKRDASRQHWTPSGVCSDSSAADYGVGDYRDWWLFERSVVKRLALSRPPITIARGTSQGVLLPITDAWRYSPRVFHWLDHEPNGTPYADAIRWTIGNDARLWAQEER